MSTKLITFLGRGLPPRDGVRQPYRKARYRFEHGDASWDSSPVPHFARAVIDFHHSRAVPIEAITVLGTNGSMWDVLFDSFVSEPDGAGAEGNSAAQLEALWERTVQQVDDQAVQESLLAELETLLTAVSGLSIQLRLIPPAIAPAGQARILEMLTDQIGDGDRIWLDVTNGFRHLPMLGLASAAIAASIRGATIEEIGYGAFEMTRDGVTPVVSLGWILRLLQVLSAVDGLSRYRQMRPLIDCFPSGKVRNSLETAAYHLDTMRVDQASHSIRDCLNLMEQDSASLPIELQSVVGMLQQRLETMTRQQRDLRGLIEMADHALAEDDFLRTAIFLSEAIELAKEKGLPGDGTQDDQLQAVRHWMAHAGKLKRGAQDRQVRQLVQNRNGLRKFLQQHADRLRKDLKP